MRSSSLTCVAAIAAAFAAGPACGGTQPAPTAPVTTSAAPSPSATAPTPAPAPEGRNGRPGKVATITVTASTNTPGITISVREDGVAHWKDTPLEHGYGVPNCRVTEGEVSLGSNAQTLFHDIPSDVHLADLPVQTCAKPASFRTTTTLDLSGDKSGDLSCEATDPRTAALVRDVEAVRRAVRAACQ